MERHAFYSIAFFMGQIPTVANHVLVRLEEGQKFREILNDMIESHYYHGVEVDISKIERKLEMFNGHLIPHYFIEVKAV